MKGRHGVNQVVKRRFTDLSFGSLQIRTCLHFVAYSINSIAVPNQRPTPNFSLIGTFLQTGQKDDA